MSRGTGTAKHAESGWGGEDLVVCLDGPRAGAWYTAKTWTALRAAAAHNGETTHTGRALGYVRTGEKEPHRLNPRALGHILAWAPDVAAKAAGRSPQ